jgi:hypothetical protein
MMRLNVTEIEAMALGGIIFCNEGMHFITLLNLCFVVSVAQHCDCPEVAEMQEQVIRELYEYLAQNYDQNMVGSRMASLIMLLTDMDVSFYEYCNLCKKSIFTEIT